MSTKTKLVTSVGELLAASKENDTTQIILGASMSDVPPVRLLPGQALCSNREGPVTLTFREKVDGLQVTSNNTVSSVHLHASPEKRAIWNETGLEDLGTILLQSLQTVGRVQILAKDIVRKGRVEVDGLDVISADGRGELERPHEYGVDVLQGAFTLWNMQPDEGAVMSADLVNLSAGRFNAPVRGTGIFVSGAGDRGGRLNVQRLETGAVYVDGGIPPGTPDQISGAVFVVYGVDVDQVTNHGPVVTYGSNDMALDNWGVVEKWIAEAKITTFGASGIGFVNFGTIRDLRAQAPIETFGKGARGFNVYAGTVDRAGFDRIVTHGDGAVGIQISQPIGTLTLRRGIETHGGTGPSLVRGVVQNLSAIALSIKPGGSAERIKVEGGLKTHNKDISPLEQEGTVQSLVIDGGFGHAGITGPVA